MKNLFVYFVLFVTGILFSTANAQEVTDSSTISPKYYIVIKNDGSEYVGRILTQNEREVLLETKKLGKMYIPKHEISEIKEIEATKITKDGDLIAEEIFASRYFITTNGLSIKKGDSYIQWNIYGPDFQFAVADNLSLGLMTSWVGVPIIATAKYSIGLDDNLHLGLGALLGTGSWAQLNLGGALPFACLTIGNKSTNLNVSSGYGYIFNKDNGEGRLLLSIAGMTKTGKKISIVLDSFILPDISNSAGFGLFIPGIRWQSDSKKAFQFGFAGIYVDGEFQPVTFPMIQWYRKL
jgi:hypothetical protein